MGAICGGPQPEPDEKLSDKEGCLQPNPDDDLSDQQGSQPCTTLPEPKNEPKPNSAAQQDINENDTNECMDRGAAAAEHQGSDECAIIERKAYDSLLRTKLLQHATPQSMAVTLKAAIVFKHRASLARKVIAARKRDGVAETVIAMPCAVPSKSLELFSPTAREAELSSLQRQMSREEKIYDGLQLLEQRVQFVGVTVEEMLDDGNCQFRALAHELYGHQRHHELVRRKVCAYLEAHADSYSFFVGDQQEWDLYLAKMKESCCWGDELTLSVAAEALDCVVHVVTTEHQNWLLRYGTQPEGVDERRQCFLTYVSPIHYNVLAVIDVAPFGFARRIC